MKKLLCIAALVLAANNASAGAGGIDWCEVLMCLAHPEDFNNVPKCSAVVPQAFSYAKAKQEWGSCPDSTTSWVEVQDWNTQYHYNKKGGIEGVKSRNGTAVLFLDSKEKRRYPF